MNKNLSEVNLYQLYSKWFEGTYYFQCFVRATNFVSLKQYPDFPLGSVSIEEDNLYRKLELIVDKYLSKNTIYFLDLPGAVVIKNGYLLQKNKGIKPIITFNNILHPYGMVGGKEYINSLIGYGELVENMDIITYSFILDSSRYKDYEKEDYKKFFNNQYEMTDEDLPSFEMLQWMGFSQCVYLCSLEEKEDMKEYLQYLGDNGIKVIKESLGEGNLL